MKFLTTIIKVLTTPVFIGELAEYKLIISLIVVSLLLFVAKSTGFIFDKSDNSAGSGILFFIYIIGSFPIVLSYIIAYFRNKTNEVHSGSDLFFLCLSILFLLPALYILPSLI